MKTRGLTGLLCSALFLCGPVSLHAQHGHGGGMSTGQRSGFPGGGGFPSAGGPARSPAPNTRNGGANSPTRGGLRLGPPGRWWDDKGFANSIGLRKDQQKKMDLIFNTNKSAILENYNSLQREESKLESLSKEPQPDRTRLFAQIDAVNQARSSLEKANAQMLLQIRQEMDPEQLTRMDKFREKPPDEAEN
jgi:Spy/CpxP family protein refolding chaperone